MGPDGPLPVELGPGHRIDDPLARQGPGAVRSIREEKLETWTSILRNRISLLSSRLERVQKALDELVPPEDYRIWGGLLLSRDDIRRKGLSELRMTDWEGREHTIPLKPSRSLKANASRFFRKAANSIKEKTSLERRSRETRKEMEHLSRELDSSEALELDELEEKLREHRSSRTRERNERSSPLLKELAGGWRCFIGRNARQNEEVTFGIGRKGDLWFHARGIPGAHVVLKLDGKTENPPASVIREAALEAARGSGVLSGVVPVDYTRVQYVNRMKKGKTGQVTYSREKTLFVDLGGGK
jgi:predicted ribosome quality control (RQC) complex YloA/Tae2 family protein